jgi:3-keto-L-gulonate-6-phosphate decarboxylase
MKIERKVAIIDGMLTVDLKVCDLATLQRRRSDEAHADCLAVVAATIHSADRFHAVALNQAGNNYSIEATVTTASSVPDAIGSLIQQFGSGLSGSLNF